ncbi:hypothetical protein Drorol1_Dr00000659 [Drosera rotundifolia]
MEFLKTPISSKLSPFTPKSSITILTHRNPSRTLKTHLQFPSKVPFWTNFHPPIRRILRVSAHFSRRGPTNRRNSLRRKILGDPKVRPISPKINDPVEICDDFAVFESNLEKGSEGLGLEQKGLLEKRGSSFADRLESWVNQCKEDIEFWGAGSDPIFIVSMDRDGNVERVSVDEDEIVRRSDVEIESYKENVESEEFEVVNSRIVRARKLAKEIECGNHVIPRNSTVAKFVVLGEESSSVGGFRSVVGAWRDTLPKMPVPNVSLRSLGFAIVGGFVVLLLSRIVFIKLKGFWNETERERMEKEKEKEKKGAVEVVEELVDRPKVNGERPHLDEAELWNSIRKAKGSCAEPALLDNRCNQDKDSDMDHKIQEIRRTARHAREAERERTTSKSVKQTEPVSRKPSISEKLEQNEEKDIDFGMDENLSGTRDGVETELSGKSESIDANWDEDSSKMKNVNGAVVAKVIEKVGSNGAMINRDSRETREINGSVEAQFLENYEKSDPKLSGEVDSGANVEGEVCSSSNEKLVGDAADTCLDSGSTHDKLNSSGLEETVPSSGIFTKQSHFSNGTIKRRKPKVILSVNEAREYLAKKHGTQVYHVEPKDKDVKTAATATNEVLSTEKVQAEIKHQAEGKVVPSVLVGVSVGTSSRITSESSCKKGEAFLSTGIVGQQEIQGTTHESAEGTAVPSGFGGMLGNTLGTKTRATPPTQVLPSWTGSGTIESETPCRKESGFFSSDVVGQQEIQVTSLLEASAVGLTSTEAPSSDMEQSIQLAVEGVKVLDPNNSSDDSGTTHDVSALDHSEVIEKERLLSENNDNESSDAKAEVDQLLAKDINMVSKDDAGNGEMAPFIDKESWVQKNFHEFKPVIEKISAGFRDSYEVARDKVIQEPNASVDMSALRSILQGDELEWMNDDELRKIVFKVRENELSGRDPFHLMEPEDKATFFKGLEKKVEIETQKMATLHQFLHSNIENLDYGADGISVFDPPAKFVPRWKGPPMDEIVEFLNHESPLPQKPASLQKSNETAEQKNVSTSNKVPNATTEPEKKATKRLKTNIQSSDGSVQPGKKHGKEYWEHTKKWTREFRDAYNAEQDPEAKAVMRDMGKDLDRWMTEKEIKAAGKLAELLRGKSLELSEKSLGKLKKEVKIFGQAAVISKYREYGEEEEEDYLWWLDLPYVLCIELYTPAEEEDDMDVGFYSLEMATDLELEPKPKHVIAFENPADCKSLCIIIQTHMEMLGEGKAFVVAQPPKDVYRLAKEKGFGVTVIRKGQITLNVDQPLEEVDAMITEIGSKMYYDKMTRERSVDMKSLMQGIFSQGPQGKSQRPSGFRLKRPANRKAKS